MITVAAHRKPSLILQTHCVLINLYSSVCFYLCIYVLASAERDRDGHKKAAIRKNIYNNVRVVNLRVIFFLVIYNREFM